MAKTPIEKSPTPSNSTPKPGRPVESIRRAPKQTTVPQAGTKLEQTSSSPTPGSTSTSGAKQTSTLKIVLIVVGVLVALSVLGGLVSRFVAKGIFDGGVSVLSGGKAKVDSKNGSVTIKGDNGKATLSTEQKLPAGFPTDVPIYQPSTIKFSASLSKGSYSVTLSTNDSSAMVEKYYEKQLPSNGWAVKENSHVTFGAVSTTTYTKGASDLIVVITGSGNNSGATAVSLAYRANASGQ